MIRTIPTVVRSIQPAQSCLDTQAPPIVVRELTATANNDDVQGFIYPSGTVRTFVCPADPAPTSTCPPGPVPGFGGLLEALIRLVLPGPTNPTVR